MRVFFGGDNNATAIAIFARWWERAIVTANKQVKNDTDWFYDDLKQQIMGEVLRRGVLGVVKDAAHSEQHRIQNSSEANS